VCFVLCVTLFPFVIFLADLKGFSHTLCHIICMCMLSVLCLIILICVELKFITHACIEVNIHPCTMLLVFYTVAVVNIGCCEGKNCGRLVAVGVRDGSHSVLAVLAWQW
jgi:hypothetical protein